MSKIHHLPQHSSSHAPDSTHQQAGRRVGVKTRRSHPNERVAQDDNRNKVIVTWLFKTLVREFPAMDQGCLSKAISAALRYHLRHPEDFESAKGLPLKYYLLYSASRFLRNRVSVRKAA